MRKPTGRPSGRPRTFEITRQDLQGLYVERGMSQRETAMELGCHQETVRYWLSKYGIEAKPKGTAPYIHIPEEDMRRMYHEQKLTAREIGKRTGCGQTTVWKHIFRYGLQLDGAEQTARKLERNKGRFYEAKRKSGGYLFTKKVGHHLANKNGYVSEHRVAVEAAMGRPLTSGERVHHINLNKQDNRPENLAVLPSISMHRQYHAYMERVGAYLCGLMDICPEPLEFGMPVFWGGKYVTVVDLVPRSHDGLRTGLHNRAEVQRSPATIN